MFTRRDWLLTTASLAQAATKTADSLKALEAKAGGRLGVAILDTKDGRFLAGNRIDERFALCSTFKVLLAAVALRELPLTEVLPYTEKDLVANSPVTKENLGRGGGMTIAALAEATQTTSDNAAANLLIKRLGGPAILTAKLRALGDTVTRIDDYEPRMNLVLPGDVRNTTTPRAMAKTVAGLAGMDKLIDWMIATKTGTKRIRAGLPPNWRAGDKTGTGMSDAMTDKYNDVAIVWPAPKRAPFVIAAYYDTPRHSADMRDEDQAVLAEVGRIAAAAIGI